MLKSLLGAVAILFAAGCASAQPADGPKMPDRCSAIWVTRWDYRSPEDVERAIDDAANIGFTDVLWQARGQADAFYKSELEPWGHQLRDATPQRADPNWDPLTVACARAHSRGMRIHAWMNVVPLWKGNVPPTDPAHIYNARPEWRCSDAAGNFQPLDKDYYVHLNITHPDVIDHTVAVFRDVMERYDLDGVHLDYVRFEPALIPDAGPVFPSDPATLERFAGDTGRLGLTSPDDRAAFRIWIRTRVTHLVRRIRDEALVVRPGAVLTAAVWRRPEIADGKYMQDAPSWLREGLLDGAFPMIYTDKDPQFDGDLRAWVEAAQGRWIAPGLGVYLQRPEQALAQVAATRSILGHDRYALFAYSTIFESVNESQARDDRALADRVQRRSLIKAILSAEATVPTPPAEQGE